MSWIIWLLAAVLLLLVLALLLPVFVVVRYRTDSDPQAYLRWAFFRYSLLSAKQRREGGQAPEKPLDAKQKKQKKKGLLPTAFSEQLAMGVDLLASLEEPVKLLLRRFYFYKIQLFMLVAEEDAAQTAISYGQVNAVVYGAYVAAGHFLNLSIPEIEIRPNFHANEGEVQFELRGRLLPIVLLGAALWAGGGFLRRTMKRAKEDTAPNRPQRDQGVETPEAAQNAERADCVEGGERPEAVERAECIERLDAADRADAADADVWKQAKNCANGLECTDRADALEKPDAPDRADAPERLDNV